MIYMDVGLLLYQLLMAVSAVNTLKAEMHPQTLVPGHISYTFFLIYILVSGGDTGRECGVQRAAFPRLCSLAPEDNFFRVQNPSGCSLETAPHLRRVTLKCHFWSPNQSAFSFVIGRKLMVKLQGISTTAVKFQKYFVLQKL